MNINSDTPELYVGPPDSGALAETAEAILKAEDEWIGKMMRDIMPPELFEQHFYAHKCHARKAIARWCGDNGVRVEKQPNKTELWKGDKLLGAFRVKVEAKFQIEELSCQPKQKDGLCS
jgi:hypothetical protein